jgi:hypothetical protein
VIEWPVVVVVSFAVILAVYEFLVRRWNVIRFLSGMKPLPPRPAEGAVKSQLGSAGRTG